MTLFKKLLASVLVFATALTATNSFADTKPTRTLQIGIENGYFPYEYLDDQGNFTGFDVELINFVCAEIKANCVLNRGAFEALIPNLLFKKSDIVISALSVTDERKKRVAFSTPYISPKPAVYIVNNNTKLKDPKQVKVLGVQQGTTLAAYLKATLPSNVQVRYYSSFDTAMLDLKGGRLDAVFESSDVAQKYLASENDLVKTLGAPVYSDLISQGVAIAVRPTDKTLLAEINQALVKAKETGLLDRLYVKYNIDSE
ncbi:transporter substrate-binding domain-containing protein [Psittacicella hinzii]|nr:transporter substrate-binding domain-containing protein [Psittacicella hinzii]